MTDLQATARQVRELIRLALSMPANSVRPANQGGPADGSEQFATVLLTPINATGVDDERFVNELSPSENVEESIVGQRRLLASVQFFRGDAMTKAVRLWQALNLSSSLERMQNIGLGLVRSSPVRDLSAIDDTKWEPRAQLDIEFHLIAIESTTTRTFGTFPIEVATETLTTTNEVKAP